MIKPNSRIGALSVMMLCFFSMGFADMVGIGSNYVQAELGLNNSLGGIMISVAFMWFLLISVPTGILMNRIGRKKTVMLALGVTTLSLVLPMITLIPHVENVRFYIYIFAFALLGMGNALMQTSLNPLVANVVNAESFSSSLALGQFVKALCSFAVPLIAQWGATSVLAAVVPWGWKVIYPISSLIAALALLLLYFTPIKEVLAEDAKEKKVMSEMKACFSMLKSPYVLLCFIAVMCTAGLDIGTNSTAPKLLMERLNMPLAEAGFATSFYFIFRTIGCFAGSAILAKWSDKKFYLVSSIMLATSMLLMAIGQSQVVLYTALALAGIGNANLCIIVFTRVLRYDPKHENELAGLMVTGLFGAMVFPLVMGVASDAFAQMGMLPTLGAILIMGIASIYLLAFTKKL